MSTNHNLFEEKGEPKRNRAEVLPPYHWAEPARAIKFGSIVLFIRLFVQVSEHVARMQATARCTRLK